MRSLLYFHFLHMRKFRVTVWISVYSGTFFRAVKLMSIVIDRDWRIIFAATLSDVSDIQKMYWKWKYKSERSILTSLNDKHVMCISIPKRYYTNVSFIKLRNELLDRIVFCEFYFCGFCFSLSMFSRTCFAVLLSQFWPLHANEKICKL